MRFERLENKNYAIDDHMETELKVLTYNMLKNQKIRCLLPVQFRYVDNRVLAEYDITGLQPLTRIYERRKMILKDIMDIVRAVYNAGEEMEEYLLTGDDLSYNPELIFAQAEGEGYLFCCQLKGGEEEDTLIKLGKFIMDRVDYDDKESVGLAYSVVKAIESDNIRDAIEKFVNDERNISAAEELKDKENAEDEGIFMPEFVPKKKKKRWFFKEKKENRAVGVVAALPEPERPQEKRKEKFITQPLDRQLVEKHYYLQPMGEREHNERIEMSHFPFVIGKLEDGVDYRPESQMVSRLHAKIDYSGEGIQVEDLNSSNGTFVNGDSVFGRGRVLLKDGDIISFANLDYRFEVYGRR